MRPAGSYVMDRLELRRVTFYPGMNVAEAEDIVILIGNFAMPTGLRAAEATLSNHLVCCSINVVLLIESLIVNTVLFVCLFLIGYFITFRFVGASCT